MSVNYNDGVVEEIVSVWAKLPAEVRSEVVEATSQLLTASKRFSEDTTDAEISDVMDELFHTLPAEVRQGVMDTLSVIARHINI